jgi:hypothetical protein
VTPKVSNKELRLVAADAERRGWILAAGGGGHHRLSNQHHRITVASSPSDANAHKHMARRIAACEAGTCEHGLPAAMVKSKAETRDARIAEAEARAQRQVEAALKRAMTHTHTSIIGVSKEPKVTKAKTKRRSPKREAAAKWAKWYVSSRDAGVELPQGRVRAAAEEAGHRWPLARPALIAAGLTPVDHGRNGTGWLFPVVDKADAAPVVEDGGQKSTHTASITHESARGEGGATSYASSPVSSGESLLSLAELARERGRMEGMCIAADALLGGGTTMQDQLAKLMGVIADGVVA